MSALESAEALLFRLLERYAFVDDLESNSKSCVEQATELCCGIIEADRRAVALRVFDEIHDRAAQQIAPVPFRVFMAELRAKYEGADQ